MSEHFYKLRHKPTGKFFRTASGYPWNKTNFSPGGRIYSKTPNKGYLGDYLYVKGRETTSVILEDWEVVVFRIVEDSVEDLK